LDFQYNGSISGLNGKFVDEVSLLNAVAKKGYQAEITIEYDENSDQLLRFKAFVSINKRLVGIGVG
jgi:hypothetical protein